MVRYQPWLTNLSTIDLFSKDLIHLINIALFRFDRLSRKCHIKGTPWLGKLKKALDLFLNILNRDYKELLRTSIRINQPIEHIFIIK